MLCTTLEDSITSTDVNHATISACDMPIQVRNEDPTRINDR